MRTDLDALRSLQRYVWKALADDMPLSIEGVPTPWEVRFEAVEGQFSFPFVQVATATPQAASGPASWQEVVRTYVVHAYPVPQSDAEASVMEAARVEELLYGAFKIGFAYSDPLGPPVGLASAIVPKGGALAAGTHVYAVTAVSADGESVISNTVSVSTSGSTGQVILGWTEQQGALSYNVYRGASVPGLRLLTSVEDAFFTDDGSGSTTSTVPPVSGTGTARVRSAPDRIPLYDYAGVALDGAASVSNQRSPHDYLRVTSLSIDRLIDPEDDRYWVVVAQPRIAYRRRGRVPTGTEIVQDVRMRVSSVA